MRFLVADGVASKKEEVLNISYNSADLAPVVSYIKSKRPMLLAVIFGGPDQVGHSIGHDTDAYYETLEKVDEGIGAIKQACKDAGIIKNTIFILSADHGGHSTTHGLDIPADREIPFIISGKGVRKNYEIQTQVHIYDIAPTIAKILDLEAPSVWTGSAINEVFR